MRRRVSAVVMVAGLVACSAEGNNPLAPIAAKPSAAIVDATNGGRAGFYFLTPIVDNPAVAGPFDGTITPRARVCALNAARTACASTLVTMPTGSGPGMLKADATTGAFAGIWSSPNSLAFSTTSGTETRYRLEIELDVGSSPVIMGYADLWVVAKQKDLKTKPVGFVGLVRGSNLQIRFGVLPATVSYVLVTPNPASVNIGQTQQMTAAAYDIHNAVVPGAVFTWSSDNVAVAGVNSNGLATGVTNGSTNINATTSGVTGSAVINVIGTPPAPPDATADGPSGTSVPGNAFHVAFNTTLNSGGTTPNLLANDNRGSPLANVSSFGAGDLGGTVTNNAAGATATFGTGGSLQLNADGSFSFTPSTGFTGEFDFSYRIQNGSGSSDAQVTIAVGARPSASDVTYPATVVGNVPINTSTSTGFTVAATGDGATYNITGSSGGSAIVHNDRTFEFTPDVAHTGPASFTFTTTNGFGTSSAATVSLTVGTPVWFVDAAAAPGGDGRKGSPFNCLVGASGCYNGSANLPGHIIKVAPGTYNGTGALVLKNTQRVIGQAGFAAAAGITWPADAGPPPPSGDSKPTIHSASGDGVTLASGNTLHGFIAGNATTASIVGSAVGTLNLVAMDIINPSGRALDLTTSGTLAASFGVIQAFAGTGNGINLVNQTGTLTSASTRISGVNGRGINVIASSGFSFGITRIDGGASTAEGVHLQQITGTTSFASLQITTPNGKGLFASVSGTINIGGGTIAATGSSAIDASNVTFSGAGFTSTSAAAVGATWGIRLTGVSGSLALGAGSLSGTTGTVEALRIENSSGTISYAGSITSSTGGVFIFNNGVPAPCPNVTLSGTISTTSFFGIIVQYCNAGAIRFDGLTKTITTSGTNAGVALAQNIGATIDFDNGGLAITTAGGRAFFAVFGGTVTVQGTGNTISSGAGGTPLHVESTNIGSSGLTFRSISSNGGEGIILNSTGTTDGTHGGLIVTGNGGSCTSGDPTCSGGRILNAIGDGISLTSTRGTSLSLMEVAGNDGSGIRAASARSFSFTDLLVRNNTDAAGPEHGMFLTDITGESTVTRAEVTGSTSDNVRVQQSTGTGTIFFTNSVIKDNGTAFGNNGIICLTATSGNLTCRVSQTSFAGNRGIAMFAVALDNSSLTATFDGNTIVAGAPNQGNTGIRLDSNGNGALTYVLQGNCIGKNRGLDGLCSGADAPLLTDGISVSGSCVVGQTCSLSGTLLRNTVHTVGSGIGILVQNANLSNIAANVLDNTVTSSGSNWGILIRSSGAPGVFAFGRGIVRTSVTGNSATVSTTTGLDAIQISAADNKTICAKAISGNSSSGAGPTWARLSARQSAGGVINMEGLATGPQTAATMKTFLESQNPLISPTDITAVGSFTGVPANTCGTTVP